jgi:beta-lactamase superfamily II metal-dependent hydrolase
MRKSLGFVLGLCLALSASSARAQSGKTLNIYVVDVEGGNATLFVSPSGESVLIDTGNPGPAAKRDADRIMAAVKDAGVTQIDNLITTHWHGDHFGGMAELATRIQIKNFIDHGPNMQPGPVPDAFLQTYPEIYSKAKHMVAKPGDKLAVGGLDWQLVSSAGEVITKPLAGAGAPNPACSTTQPNMDEGGVENSMSVGSVITFGKFRVAHLGDLTQVKEFPLMCPVNRIGTFDLWIVSHHGQPMSNSQVLVHAIQPRVAILNNGTRKGGQPAAMKVIYGAPGLEDLWQLHFSLLSGQEYSQPGYFIANMIDDQPENMPIAPMTPPTPGPGTPPPPAHNGQAYWVKVSAQADGTFTVTNTRNGFSKTYLPRTAK